MDKNYYTYLLSNKRKTVLYTGVTNDLARRVYEHKTSKTRGFTQKYNVDCLVYFESYLDIDLAILREKQIKGWLREKKEALINEHNPDWHDLYESIL